MVVDTAGGAYVGNFGFDLHADMSKRGDQAVIADHPVAKLARINAKGEASVAAEDMHFPNGSVITPDGNTLIVGETLGGCLTAFDIGPDGALSGRRLFVTTWPRVPDGICLDANGSIWVANALAPECVLYSADGEVLDIVQRFRIALHACSAARTERCSS